MRTGGDVRESGDVISFDMPAEKKDFLRWRERNGKGFVSMRSRARTSCFTRLPATIWRLGSRKAFRTPSTARSMRVPCASSGKTNPSNRTTAEIALRVTFDDVSRAFLHFPGASGFTGANAGVGFRRTGDSRDMESPGRFLPAANVRPRASPRNPTIRTRSTSARHCVRHCVVPCGWRSSVRRGRVARRSKCLSTWSRSQIGPQQLRVVARVQGEDRWRGRRRLSESGGRGTCPRSSWSAGSDPSLRASITCPHQ